MTFIENCGFDYKPVLNDYNFNFRKITSKGIYNQIKHILKLNEKD